MWVNFGRFKSIFCRRRPRSIFPKEPCAKVSGTNVFCAGPLLVDVGRLLVDVYMDFIFKSILTMILNHFFKVQFSTTKLSYLFSSEDGPFSYNNLVIFNRSYRQDAQFLPLSVGLPPSLPPSLPPARRPPHLPPSLCPHASLPPSLPLPLGLPPSIPLSVGIHVFIPIPFVKLPDVPPPSPHARPFPPFPPSLSRRAWAARRALATRSTRLSRTWGCSPEPSKLKHQSGRGSLGRSQQ